MSAGYARIDRGSTFRLRTLATSGRFSSTCALEKAGEILRFKASYRPGHEIATVNRALSTLRAAINWGRFQDPALLTTSPFHRFGVTIKTRDETKRDRRVGPSEEKTQGRLAPILKRRAKLGPNAYVFGTDSGGFQASFKTAWEALLLVANRYETKRAKPGVWVARDRQAPANRPALARPATRRGLSAPG